MSHELIIHKLREQAIDFLKKTKYRGVRSSQCINLFERVMYISPENIVLENYIRRKPSAAFNPGALIVDGSLLVFPRLIFDYYWYISSIGMFSIKLNHFSKERDLHVNKTYRTKIIYYPTETWELLGCEDPRVVLYNDKYHILYTAREITSLEGDYKAIQGYAILDKNLNVVSKKFFKITHKGSTYIPLWKDSAFIEILNNEASLLARPSIPFNNKFIEIGWWTLVNLDSGEAELDSFKPILPIEEWELKVGFSTNTLEISSNEYLIGWHGVAQDYVYRNGLAIVSPDGELLGITNYVLQPEGLNEVYGDRPGVTFGCGLVSYKDHIYWVGGISDYAIGIFRADINKVFESIKWIKG